MNLNKSSLAKTVACYAIWGVAPLYWSLLSQYRSLFTLADRILWGLVILGLYLACTHKLPQLWRTLGDWSKMKFMIPATIMVCINWGVYIWAMGHGHVIDSALGYYFNPLLSALLGLWLFRERLNRGQLLAYGLALAGVTLATIDAGRLPLISIVLALSFAIYGTVKKFAQVDPAVSVTLETLLAAPFCLLYMTTLGRGDFALIAGAGQVLLLMGAGLLTAVPLVLFAHGVNDLPLSVLGFVQFLSPTLALACGLLLGETMSGLRWLCMICIWIAVVVFTLSATRRQGHTPPRPQPVTEESLCKPAS